MSVAMFNNGETVETYISFMGFEATLLVTYEITDWGYPAVVDDIYGGDPGAGPEWNVTDIGVTLELDNGPGVEWMVNWPSAEFTLLANHARVDDAILADICGMAPPRSRRGHYAGYWI